ncbi:MAG: M48 family metallopeptidase [Muribaculaceae bacterium]|nr:M48 family metallopeptidase [Muribaculaceae bacterium]
MIKGIFKGILVSVLLICNLPVNAQFNLKKAVSSATKAVQAFTLTDDQMADYVRESVNWMDTHNPVLPDYNPYVVRLNALTEGITDADGIPLNFKVYDVIDINAFACPDGSVRVFSSLMDLMDDDELMGVIGHEIGHVMKHHSKNAFKTELLTGAMKDAISSTGGKAAALTDSQFGTLSSALINAKYSQKQEKEADECGYDFLVANGRNPWGMVMAFEKLESLENQSGGSSNYINKMFSSHPETKDRIKKMSDRATKEGIARPAKTDSTEAE